MKTCFGNLTINPYLVARSFYDVDEFAEFMNSTGRQAQIDQISLDSFCTDVWLIDFGNLQVGFGKFGCPMHHIGERRKGFIHFDVLLEAGSGPNRIHGHPVGTDHIFSFNFQRGSDTVLSSGTLIADVLVEQDLFAGTCHALRREDINTQFLHCDLAYFPTSLKVYQGYLRELLSLLQARSSLLQSPYYRQIIMGDLLPLLIDAIPRQKTNFLHPPAASCRAKLMRRAREFIQANLHRPLTLKDIYTDLGISRRTLYYGFENMFDMTPMEYLRIQRLLGARRSLKQADPKTAKVTAIAHQWGFYNLGHFAKAYKAMFNQLPSQTLGKV